MIVGLIYIPLFEAVWRVRELNDTELSFRKCILTNNNGNLYKFFFLFFNHSFPTAKGFWDLFNRKQSTVKGAVL